MGMVETLVVGNAEAPVTVPSQTRSRRQGWFASADCSPPCRRDSLGITADVAVYCEAAQPMEIVFAAERLDADAVPRDAERHR